MPTFTVIVFTYHRRVFLREAVESVLRQELPQSDFEVIVVKSFSDADLDAWLAQQGPTVRVVTEDLPLTGQMVARGVELARGRILCFLNDDDRFRPTKLTGIRELFDTEPELLFVKSRPAFIDGAGRPMVRDGPARGRPPRFTEIVSSRGAWDDIATIYDWGLIYCESAMAIRTDVLRPWLPYLSRVSGPTDAGLLFLTTLTDGRLRGEFRADDTAWTEYRQHRGEGVGSGSRAPENALGGKDVLDPDPTRSRRAWQRESDLYEAFILVVEEVARLRPDRQLTVRLAAVLRLRESVARFLSDPEARLSVRDWIGYLLSLARVRYRAPERLWLFALGAICPLRWLRPQAAARSFRRWRQSELQRVTRVG